MDRLRRIDETIDQIEQILIIVFLSLMILTAFMQIILRNLFSTGLTWGDPLVRNLVLWVGFVGATLATREGRHISIDVLSRWISPSGKKLMEFLTHLFAFFVCVLLTFAAYKFIKNEMAMETIAFLGVPSWIPEIILPIIFGLMTFRYGLLSLSHLFKMVKRDGRPHPGGKN